MMRFTYVRQNVLKMKKKFDSSAPPRAPLSLFAPKQIKLRFEIKLDRLFLEPQKRPRAVFKPPVCYLQFRNFKI
jgi:hypothetical protein